MRPGRGIYVFACALAVAQLGCGSSSGPAGGGADASSDGAPRGDAASDRATGMDSPTTDAGDASPDAPLQHGADGGIPCGNTTCNPGSLCCYPQCSICSSGKTCGPPPGGC